MRTSEQTDVPPVPTFSPSHRRTFRRTWRLLRIAALVYLGLILVFSLLQEQMIFPGHASQGQQYAVIAPSRDSELVQLKTAHGDQIYILFGKAMNREGVIRDDSASRPSIIFFYGNAMSLADGIGFCREWRRLGANVVGVEYPGYGMSGGKPGETAIYAAADAAYDWLAARGDIDKNKIIPVGLSLGTGAAVDLASRKPVAGLALFAPFTSLDDLARHVTPWLPTSLILRHHFASEKKIGSLRIPILIAHGRHDTIIPHEMSQRLAASAKNATVTLLMVDSDHNDLFDEAGAEVNAALAKLIDNVATGTPVQ